LDPAVVVDIDGCDVRLSCAGTEGRTDSPKAVWLLPDDSAAELSLSVESGWVSPRYGVKVATKMLVWSGRSRIPIVASYLFAESRLPREERIAVSGALTCGGGWAES